MGIILKPIILEFWATFEIRFLFKSLIYFNEVNHSKGIKDVNTKPGILLGTIARHGTQL